MSKLNRISSSVSSTALSPDESETQLGNAGLNDNLQLSCTSSSPEMSRSSLVINNDSVPEFITTQTSPPAQTKAYHCTLVGEITPEFKKLLECPSCKEISVPPIYLCEQGHIVCHSCHGKLNECSKCDSPFTTMRNELAEAMVSSREFKCPFKGCRIKQLMGSQVKDHLENCDFRPILCTIHTSEKNSNKRHNNKCNIMIPFDDYVDHLIGNHKVLGVENQAAIVNMSTTVKLGQGNWTFPPHYLKTFGKTFLCHIHASYNLFIGWISLYGTEDEIKEYAGAVTIFNTSREWEQVKWVGQVHSFRSSAQQVYDSGKCLVLLPETFLLFADLGEREDKTKDAAGYPKKSQEMEDERNKVKRWSCHFEVHKIKHLEEEAENEPEEE